MSTDERWEIAPEDEEYPESLRPIEDIAARIYGKGDKAVLKTRCISIIGARKATPYGLAVARMAARVAAECDITVVSGGAMGCDFAATEAALEAGGKTIIVSGCGADRIYPRSSESIFRETVASGGALISLEHWGTNVHRYAFPKRNNVIAALSDSIVVAEAGVPSGTISTAERAIDLEKNLYVIPGSIFSPNSRGTNLLLEQGVAFMIPDELALELRIAADYGAERVVLDGPVRESGRVLSALIANPMRPEELAEQLSCEIITIMKTLTEKEAAGEVERLPDGRYSPTAGVLMRHNTRKVEKHAELARGKDG